jgi:hypothetical protein
MIDDKANAELWITFERETPATGKMRIKNVEYTTVSLTSESGDQQQQVGILAKNQCDSNEILALWGVFELGKLRMDTFCFS